MATINECKVPLMWNANGFVEIIQQDDIPQDEAERFIKHLECSMSPNSDIIFRPSSRSSNDFSSESDCQERLSIDNVEEDVQYNGYNARKHDRYVRDIHEKDDVSMMLKMRMQSVCKEEKVHVCSVCGKCFSRKFNLNTHIKCVHSDDKDYVCAFCERAFNHSSNLRKHIKTVHGGEKRLQCNLCDKPFKHPIALKNHIKLIHGHNKNGDD